MGKRLNAAQHARTNQRRTGLHNMPDKAEGGTKAPERGCVHFGCKNGFHAADCETVGLSGINLEFQRPGGESTARPRRGKKLAEQ